MFERFTERARQVVVMAQEGARQKSLDYIGVEHVLYGICAEEEGLGARVLRDQGITKELVFAQLPDGGGARESQIPFTPQAKSVLELALREALGWGHNYIGTEHLLGGLLRELDLRTNPVVAAILQDTNTTPDDIRRGLSENLVKKTKPATSHEYQLEPEKAVWEVVIEPEDELSGSKKVIPFGTTKPRYGVGVDLGTMAIVVHADHDDPVVIVPRDACIVIRQKDES